MGKFGTCEEDKQETVLEELGDDDEEEDDALLE